jgi:hypothetical protein
VAGDAAETLEKILHTRVKRPEVRSKALVPDADRLVEMVGDDFFEVVGVAARAIAARQSSQGGRHGSDERPPETAASRASGPRARPRAAAQGKGGKTSLRPRCDGSRSRSPSAQSLERVLASRYGGEPENWSASLEAGGTPGAPDSVSPPPGNEPPLAFFTATPAAGFAPLEVRVDGSQSSDADGRIESYEWDFGDGAAASGPDASATHTYTATGVYEVVLRVRDDGGGFDSFRGIVTVEDGTLRGGVIPGDDDLDGRATLSDAVSLLRRLFQGEIALALPCGGTLREAGNAVILDINGDRRINITDPIHLLNYLFRGGPASALGAECVPIEGCPEVCGL